MMFLPKNDCCIEAVPCFKETVKRATHLSGRPGEIAEAFLNRLMNRDTFDFSLPEKTLDGLLLTGDESEWGTLFKPGSDERLALETIIGLDNAALAKQMWDARPEYPFPYIGHWRPGSSFYDYWNRGQKIHLRQPPYRTSCIKEIYYRPALNAMLAFMAAIIYGFDLKSHLTVKAEKDNSLEKNSPEYAPYPFWEDEGDFVPQLIAALLDRGDDDSDQLLADLRVILAEANYPELICQVVSGLLKSNRNDANDEAAELLTNAEIREGNRFRLSRFKDDRALAVIDLMARGRSKSFLRLLKVIVDNNLSRIPEVSKAFLTWTGLAEHSFMWADLDDEFIRPGILKQNDLDLDELGIGRHQWINTSLAHALRCLTDEQHRQASLSDETPLKVFLALWATGVKSLERAESESLALLESGSRHQKLAAVALAVSIGHPARRFKLLAPLLSKQSIINDKELVAWLLSGLPNNLFEYYCRHQDGLPYENIFQLVEHASSSIKAKPGDFIYLSSEKIGRYYLDLKAIVQTFDKEISYISFNDSLMPGFPIGYTVASLCELMVQTMVRNTVWAGQIPKSQPTFHFRYLPDDHPISRFKARWKLKDKIINSLILNPQGDALDSFYLEADHSKKLIRNDVCGLLESSLTSSTSFLLVQNIIAHPDSEIQKKALIKAIFSGTSAHSYAASIFLTTELNDAELFEITNYFTSKHDQPRKLLIMKILMATEDRPQKLEEIICRLQRDEHKLKRKAASEILHIIRRRRVEPLYLNMYERLSSNKLR